ncbi:hydroxyneurosporene dehydrogenase [Streptomyces sp. HD1123-B1]|uniref:lipocalin-like domain-containing protein n=1 Tax=Streptomyces huangiella TaxID=3228804 RepID=UPI003D7ECB67
MHAVIGTLPHHYRRLNLTPGVVQPWEDGLRTAAADGTFEWWYCDAHLEDGSTLTVEFHTKPPYVSPKAPLTPFVLLTLTRPDGSRTDRTYLGEPSDFTASAEGCDVVIGPQVFRGGPDGYTVHVEIEDTVVDLALAAEVPPWRPETGHVFFGEDEERYIAWLPVVARGHVEATVTIDGVTSRLTGSGYHDHNWGNIAPRKVLDHWYWGRARLGDHTVVTLMFVSHERYGKAVLPAVLVAESGRVITSAVGADAVGFAKDEVFVHPDSGVEVAGRLTYRVGEGSSTYTITFDRDKDAFLLDFGTAGAYHRFIGDVALRHELSDGHGPSATVRGRTLWELLHFAGKAAGTDGGSGAGIPAIGHQA